MDASHYQYLQGENSQLRRQIADQGQVILRLEARITELESRLNTNSRNSSKPPSSDGLSKKPAFSKPKGGRPGGVIGHQGTTLQQVSVPDVVVDHHTDKCTCGFDLANVPTRVPGARQVFDLPKPRLEVTEHRIYRQQCPCCGTEHLSSYPAGVNAPVQYGPGVKGLSVLLNVDHKVPFKRVRQFFSDIYGYALNESTQCSANAQSYEGLQTSEQEIKKQLQASEVVHFDESGIRCQGKLQWLHVASTASHTHLFVHSKRGKDALESADSIIAAYKGRALHDCWSSYFAYTGCQHALCGAHLLRELEQQAEQGRLWAKGMQELLLKINATPFEERNAQLSLWENQYDLFCAQADQQEPLPVKGRRGKPVKSKGRNLMGRLKQYKDEVLAFARFKNVPFTNNQAERDIRPAKIKLKVSTSIRTLDAAKQYARIQAFISTTRKNGKNVYLEICRSFNGLTFLTDGST